MYRTWTVIRIGNTVLGCDLKFNKDNLTDSKRTHRNK